MGTLFGFVVGYVVGARAGAAGFDELVDSARAIRDSEEFTAFVALLREHLQSTAQQLGGRFLTPSSDVDVRNGRARGASATAQDALRAARDRLGG